MYAAQLEAYRTVQKRSSSDREVEAAVLTKAAMKLKACQDHWEAADRAEELDEAIRFNQKIWSIFQSELSRADNPLPKKVREDILSLSLFIDKRLIEMMAAPSPEKLTAVVQINLNLAAGLRNSPA